MWARYDPQDSHVIWTTSTNSDTGQVYVFDERTRQTREVSPSARTSGGAAAALRYRFNWDTPVAFGADGTTFVGGNVLFASTDRGVHWTTRSPDLTRNDKMHQTISGGPITIDASGAEMADTILQVVPVHSAPGQIWIGTDDGLVQLTRDNGATWRNVTPPAMPAWGRVYTVEAGHANAATAYVAVDAHMTGDEHPHLFATDDFGAHWRSLAGDLPPSLFVRVIREDPKNANLLYAGTQRGVWMTFDRGQHWHSLRLNMPASPVYDVQVQPDANDLIVATHGRGLWIFDDLLPVQLAASPAAAATLLAPRPAYRMWRTSPTNSFLDGTLPSGEYVGGDRPYGAIMTYDLPRAARSVAIEIIDSSGRVVRRLSGKGVSKHAALNRAVWDLSETGPVRWNGTFEQNRGPESGAEALPDAYTVRLVVDGREAQRQPLTIAPDPRDPAATADLAARHAFLMQENTDLSRVDTMLNTIDARSKHASSAQLAALASFKHRLTLDPRNIEDLGTVQLRERLLDLIGRVGSTSFRPPTEAQSAEGVQLHAQTDGLVAQFARM